MIYVNCLNVSEIDEAGYEKLYAKVSDERKQRAERYRSPEDARRCVLAEVLLRFSLKEACGYSEQIVTQYHEHGKPFIKNPENFAYNISHSGEWVLVAYTYDASGTVKDAKVGVDVEKIREFTNCEKLTIRFFAEEEQEYIFSVKNDAEKAARFTEIWTLKESYLKYLGCGLSQSLESFAVDAASGQIRDVSGNLVADVRARSFALGEEYYFSVCSDDDEITTRVIPVEAL
ncbi:MAG: 4'-phosphopantetheinyl transferase superfamily protein [Lachnospiraceae bacterium]|nr:4'-phosphopantetheinyl transferase superfamily protein [Lachnospiraceae bacterium]